MTSLIRWDPFKEMAAMQERMNRLFDEIWGRPRRVEEDYISGSWLPAVDVKESKDALEISVELPGVDPKDVEVTVEGGVLSIRGSRKFEKAEEGETYHRVERSYGSFERTFTLPSNVNPDKISASYKLGVLHLTLPKREEAKPKAIPVKVEEK